MAFGKLYQGFKIGTKVRIGQTGQDGLDGATGIIGGIASSAGRISFYIVILDNPLPYNGWLAISMIETCLEPT